MVKRIVWSKIMPWRREFTLKEFVPNVPGVYEFLDSRKSLLYVGHSKVLRHRIQSYMQKDCFPEHPTKRPLRKRIKYFRYAVTGSVDRARSFEKRKKGSAKLNFW